MPNAESPLLQAERRSWKYWREDGIPYLIAGLFGIAYSAPLLIVRQFQFSPWMMAVPMGIPLLWLLGSRPAAEYLKSRLIWPRTGYVRTPFFAGQRRPVEPLVISIMTSDAEEAELQQLRRKRYTRMVLTVLGTVTLADVVMRTGRLPGQKLVWALVGVFTAVTCFGLTRLLLFLRRHPLERA